MIFTTVNSFTILDSDSTLYFTAYLQLSYDIVVLIKKSNSYFVLKRLLEMSSVAENNRIIPAIDKLDN